MIKWPSQVIPNRRQMEPMLSNKKGAVQINSVIGRDKNIKILFLSLELNTPSPPFGISASIEIMLRI